MMNPYEAPKDISLDAPNRRSFRALLFVPVGAASPYAFFFIVSRLLNDDPNILHSAKFLSVCALSAVISSLVLVFLRVKSPWALTFLSPFFTFLGLVLWIVVERYLTNTISW